MPLSESDTRAKLIDPAIHKRGWTEDLIRREQTAGSIELTDAGPQRRPRGRVDYLLRIKVTKESQPVAVALSEAKAEHLPPTHGLEQAKLYAACKRLNVLFVYSSNGHLFIEFDRLTGLTGQPRLISEFPSIKASEDATGIPLLRMGNIKDGKIALTDPEYVRISDELATQYQLAPGDLLYCPEGRSCIQESMTRAIGQVNINAAKLRKLPLPLPSFPEQKRIAAKLADQMAAAKKLRESIEAQLQEINTLPAALLRKAFSGEL